MTEHWIRLNQISWWLTAVLSLFIVMSAAILVTGFLHLLQELQGRLLSPWLPIANLLLLISHIILALAAASTVLWVYFAHRNLRRLGVKELNYSASWAAASLLLPFANLFVPHGMMRELHNRSSGLEAHFSASSVDDVNSWWTAFVAGILLQTYITSIQLFGILFGVHVTAPSGVHTGLMLFATLLLGGAAMFEIKLVRAITNAQRINTGVAEAFA